MEQNKMDLIDAAINYWADKFTNPEYSDRANGQLEGFGSMLATFAKLSANDNTKVTPKMIEVFKDSLRKILIEQSIMKECTLDTDWAPEYPLSDCLRKAKLPGTFFPMMTMMWVNFKDHTVKVRIGNDDSEQIYPKK